MTSREEVDAALSFDPNFGSAPGQLLYDCCRHCVTASPFHPRFPDKHTEPCITCHKKREVVNVELP